VLIVVAAAMRDITGRRSFLRSRPLVALGTWSYAFYLVHLSVLHVLTTRMTIGPQGWANLLPAALCMAVAVAVSWLGYRCVEHPLERRLRSWYPRSTVAPIGVLPRSPTSVVAGAGEGQPSPLNLAEVGPD
jgi:peptidoglycan/LPS O-acetylase OafA/YrhL